MRNLLIIGFSLCCALPSVGACTERIEYFSADLNRDYRIGVHDLLEVEVFQVNDFKRALRVNTRGEITLPLIGRIKAAGLTILELEAEITRKLKEEYLQQPHVSVYIKEFASQRVTIEGEVNKPGIYSLKGTTTLLQVIAMAEGATDLADLKHVQLFRHIGDDGKKKFELNVKAIRTGARRDPIIESDDLIVIRKAGLRSAIKTVSDTLRGFFYFGRVPLH